MVNANKYIRKGIISILVSQNVPCWSNIVPDDIGNPRIYATINSMGKVEFAVSKRENEFEVRFDLNLYCVNDLGFDSATELDDIIETVLPLIKQISVPEIGIKNVTLENELDMTFNTDMSTINRKVLQFTMWVNYER